MKKVFVLALVLSIVFSAVVVGKASADLGVGVGVGKIQVDQDLKPGQIYNLPPITVLNTGTVPSEYKVLIEHQEKQPELIPQSSWLIFSPQTFHLDPKKVQKVSIKLNLPLKTPPGKYFVYLEAQPITVTQNGVTAVNIAAATKLYFTVVPGSLLEGIYYKLLSIWTVFAPIPQIILGVILLLIFILIAKRFVKIELRLSKNGIPRWAIALSVVIFFIIYLVIWVKIIPLLKH
jgi:hypothetical protein